MSWIESHQSLGRHPKLIALAARLEVSLPTSVGHLQYLWWWSVDYAPDGDLAKYDDATIAGAAEWTSTSAEAFVSALEDTGWLDGRFLHDWADYAGRLIERRKADAARKRSARTSEGQPPDVSDGRPPDGVGTAHVPTHPPTDPPTVPDPPTNPKGASAPNPKSPNDIEAAMLERLHAIEGWDSLTFGALVKLNGQYTRPVVTMALQRAREENQSPNGSAYGLLEAMCKDIEAKAWTG